MINARILVRKGLKADFDPTKMLPGEWAVSIDASTSNQIVWMCFAPGVCKRMGTYEDFQNMVYNATGQIIERYEDAFGSILEEVNTNAEAVSANTDIVLVAKSDIINTYLPQIRNYVSDASASASNAKTYSENAKVSASEAERSAEDAKKYSQNAFATTPEGYEALVGDVDVLKNSIIQTTDRTLYGSKEGGIKLVGIGGASEQKQYSGKNLLQNTATTQTVKGVTFTVNEDGSVTASGTPTEDASCIINHDILSDLVGQTLVLNGCPSGGSSSGYKLQAWHLNNGAKAYDYGSGAEFTLTEEMVSDGWNIAISITSGTTVSNLTFYPMISVEGGDYEPFVGGTQSPNPSYPQEIESVGDSGSLGIKAEGKNLAHENYIELYASNDTKLVAQSTGIKSLLIKVKPNTTYLLGRNGGTSHGTIGYLKDVPKVGDSVNVAYLGSSAKRSITTLEDTNYILWYNGTSSAIPTEVFCYETTDTTAEYEPYRSKSITIPLNEPLRKGDEIVVVNGVWGVLHGKGKEIVDGNTDITVSGASNGRYRITVTALYGKVAKASSNEIAEDLMCTHYGAIPASETYNGTQGIGLSTCGNIMIFDNKFTTADISLYKAWLAENPIEILYPLATPTFEPFTDQTPFYGLESFDTVTYISTDSEVEPSIELKFAKTEGDAVTLLNYNQTNLNRIAIAELTSAVLALNQE